MPLRSRRSIEVNAPVGEVFNYLADFGRHKEWNLLAKSDHSFVDTAPGSVKAGMHFEGTETEESVYGPITWRVTLEVTEFSPNERLVFEFRRRPGFGSLNFFEVRPTSNGTLITIWCKPLIPGPLWLLALVLPWLLFWPLLQPLFLWNDARSLRRMKVILESMVILECISSEMESVLGLAASDTYVLDREDFLERLESSGFRKSPRSGRLYYCKEIPEVRFVVRQKVVRLEKKRLKRRQRGTQWVLWESYWYGYDIRSSAGLSRSSDAFEDLVNRRLEGIEPRLRKIMRPVLLSRK